MASRNITFNLPTDLIQKTKVVAAQRGKTVNTFVRELLEETVTEPDRVRKAGEALLALAEKGPLSNVDPATIRREDLYDR